MLRHQISLILYDVLWCLILPLLLPVLVWHPRLRGGLAERFGIAPHRTFPNQRPVWLHGSSAGDVVALAPLARTLQSRGSSVVMSHWTRSGKDMARSALADIPSFYLPLDLRVVTRHVLVRMRPRLVVLECLEVWPGLIATCHGVGARVAIVNGRLSERSLQRFRRWSWLFEPCFHAMAAVTAVNEAHARRFVLAGVPAERVSICPSSKHASNEAVSAGRSQRRRRKLVLGSLHEGEGRLLLPLLGQLRVRFPQLEVVVAPRYPHLASPFQRQLDAVGVVSVLDSRADSANGNPVRVLDEVGGLRREYADALVAFVGGTLVPRGGHNLMEPAAAGAVVLHGPSVDNHEQEAVALGDVEGARCVLSSVEFAATVAELFDAPEQAIRMGANAAMIAESFSNAARQVEQVLLDLMV